MELSMLPIRPWPCVDLRSPAAGVFRILDVFTPRAHLQQKLGVDAKKQFSKGLPGHYLLPFFIDIIQDHSTHKSGLGMDAPRSH